MISLSPRSRGMLLGVGLFLLGIIVGAGADRWFLVLRMPPPLGHLPGHPPRERWLRRFQQNLHLTPEQEQAIHRILDASRDTIRQVQNRVRRKMRRITLDTRRKLEAVLTPEQREKYNEIRKRMKRRQGRRLRGRPWSY